MKWFFYMELGGKLILFLAIMFQLMVLSGFQGDNLDTGLHSISLKLDWLRHWHETGKSHPTIGWHPGNEFWSSPFRQAANTMNWYFGVAFLLGTAMTITARFFEIKDSQK